LGFGVWGLGFGVWGLGFGVWGLVFGVWGLGFGFSLIQGWGMRGGDVVINVVVQGLLQLESRIPSSMLEAKVMRCTYILTHTHTHTPTHTHTHTPHTLTQVMRPNLAKSKSSSDNRKLAAILGHLDNVEVDVFFVMNTTTIVTTTTTITITPTITTTPTMTLHTGVACQSGQGRGQRRGR